VGVGRFQVDRVTREIDCTGLVVCPGFIDLHTHCDRSIVKPNTRQNLNYLTQGCTTVVTGNCGFGPIEVGKFFRQVDEDGTGTNVIHLVPHGMVRQRVMGNAAKTASKTELDQMKTLVDRAMREGAWGMSTGLGYMPGTYADIDELVALSRVVATHGGIYASHIRQQCDKLVESVGEVVEIGRRARLPAHVSHFKVKGVSNWGRIRDAVELIERARGEGLKVTADQYPYIASSTSISATLMPASMIPGGGSDLLERIRRDPALEQAVRRLIGDRLRERPRIVVATCKCSQWIGKSLREIAAKENIDVVDLVLQIEREGGASVVNFCMSEEDVRYLMTVPWVATASDGWGFRPGSGGHPHPRSFGTFPRKIGYYSLDQKVLPLAQAIRSATGLPADILNLPRRGYLRPDYYADVVVFDPKTFIDRATFDNPQLYATGIRHLFIAGEPAIAEGKPSEKLYGRAIRHRGPLSHGSSGSSGGKSGRP